MLTLLVAVGGGVTALRLTRAARRVEAGQQVRRLGEHRRWRVPARLRTWLTRALEDAALSIEPEAACELWLAAVVGLGVVVVAIAPSLLLPSIVLAIAAGPVALRLARGRARRRFVTALPGALEHIAAGLRGGVTIGDAIEALAERDGPIASDFRRLRTRAALGSGLADALAQWPADRDLAPVRAAAGALAVATSVGGPAAKAIDGLAASMREQLGAIAEARALSAQARLSAVVVGAAPAAYLAFTALADPGSLDVLVANSTGRACLFVGLVLEVLAIVWMRRIVRSEELA